MRSTIKTKLLFTGLLAGIIAMGIVSCKKYNDWDTDASTDRLFRPTSLTAIVDGVTITLRWKPKPGTSGYTVELSKDSLQFAQILKTYNTSTITVDKDGFYMYTLPDLLDPLTRYSARIKGVDTTGGTAPSQWVEVTYKTTTEQLMEPVTDGDKTPYAVTLKWKAPNQVSHFMLDSQGVKRKIDLTDAEKTAGTKTIAGLTPKTSYTAILYYNTSIRGQQAFTLPADLPSGNDVVRVNATDDLAAMIAAQTKTYVMYVLLQGSVYTTANAFNIPNGISFTIWGEAGANKPIVNFNGLNLPLTAGTIKFENIDLTGYKDINDPAAGKRDYIFNQGTTTNTSEIIFENCIIRNLANSPMRIKDANPVYIGKFTVNNCLVYDIGDNGANGAYSFINNNVANGKIDNITLTNSTFARIGYGLILHNLAPSTSVTVNDNTFYNVTGNARLFIDYNAQSISGGFTFNNNIYAKTYSPAGSAKGIRSATVPVVTNSYKASDVNFSAGNPITGILDYTQTGADLFTDPANNNFLIKDIGFAGKSTSGDPRWRK